MEFLRAPDTGYGSRSRVVIGDQGDAASLRIDREQSRAISPTLLLLLFDCQPARLVDIIVHLI